MKYFLILFFVYTIQGASQSYSIIGVERCGVCHQSKSLGMQFQGWKKTGHATAFSILNSEKGKQIAESMGISDPNESEFCLKCHSTKGFLNTDVELSYQINEGVGCEACHGAGKGYSELSVMRDIHKAVLKGLDNHPFKTCTSCHNNRAHDIEPFNNELFWDRIKH